MLLQPRLTFSPITYKYFTFTSKYFPHPGKKVEHKDKLIAPLKQSITFYCLALHSITLPEKVVHLNVFLFITLLLIYIEQNALLLCNKYAKYNQPILDILRTQCVAISYMVCWGILDNIIFWISFSILENMLQYSREYAELFQRICWGIVEKFSGWVESNFCGWWAQQHWCSHPSTSQTQTC